MSRIVVECKSPDSHDAGSPDRAPCWGDAPAADPKWDVGVEQVFTTPYYGSTELQGYVGPYDDRLGVSFDRVPKGEIEIRRATAVICSDGEPAGHVDGFVVDADEGIT